MLPSVYDAAEELCRMVFADHAPGPERGVQAWAHWLLGGIAWPRGCGKAAPQLYNTALETARELGAAPRAVHGEELPVKMRK